MSDYRLEGIYRHTLVAIDTGGNLFLKTTVIGSKIFHSKVSFIVSRYELGLGGHNFFDDSYLFTFAFPWTACACFIVKSEELQ